MKTYSRNFSIWQVFFLAKKNSELNYSYFFVILWSLHFLKEDASKCSTYLHRTVDRYIHSGKIRTKRDGKLIMLHKDDVTQVKKWWHSDWLWGYRTKTNPRSYHWLWSREAQNEILRTLETIIRERMHLFRNWVLNWGNSGLISQILFPSSNTKRQFGSRRSKLKSHAWYGNDSPDKKELGDRYQREKLISTVLMIGVFVLLCACVVLTFHFLAWEVRFL